MERDPHAGRGERPRAKKQTAANRNILLKIEYDGTNYAGWQIQNSPQSTVHSPQKKTIQETIEKALKQILREKISIISCGRTDAGVHALSHIANFKTGADIALFKLQRALNGVLPRDIVIKEVKEVPLKFHSRFDAKSKLYRYTILNGASPSAMTRNFVWHVPFKLNLALMRREARVLVGKHDFKSFQAAGHDGRSSVRTIKRLDIRKQGDAIKINAEADGFLYNMVRNIVGTLVEIGRGRFKPGSMRRILKAKDRNLAGPTAPAKGLCLIEVKY